MALLPRVLRLLTALLQRLLLFWLLFPLTMADPDPDPNPDSGGDGFSLLGANGSLPLSQYVTMSPLPCEEGEQVLYVCNGITFALELCFCANYNYIYLSFCVIVCV